MENYNLTLNFNVATRVISVEGGLNTLYKNSIGVNKLIVNCDGLTIGQLLEVTFSQGGQVTSSLTMSSLKDGEYFITIPDVVLANEGVCAIALNVKSPVIVNGTTHYNIITTGNINVTVITSVAQPATNPIAQSVADQLFADFQTLDEGVTEALAAQDDKIDAIVVPTVGAVTVETLLPGAQATATNISATPETVLSLHLGIPSSVSITNVIKTSAQGLVDTYTITFNNGTSTTFTVTNGAKGDKGDKGDTGDTGNGIVSVEKTQTNGLVDTYTITFTNSADATFTVTNGKDFQITATFPTIQDMNAAWANYTDGAFVLIASTEDDPDNSKLFVHCAKSVADPTGWHFLTDLSGAQGIQGIGIASIAKTGTQGLVDTYTITLTSNATYTFTVNNGVSITDVSKTSTQGLVDTYTISFNDGTSSAFAITNGRAVTSIAKTSASGLVDTYTITYNDGTTSTFTVTNGKDGTNGINGIDGTSVRNGVIAFSNGLYYVSNIAGAIVGDLVFSPSGSFSGYFGTIESIGATTSALKDVVSVNGEGAGDTTVYVNGIAQASIAFSSDPQTQINTLNENIGSISGAGRTTENVKTNADNITALQTSKQAVLSSAQLAAVNSGITTEKVTKYDGYDSEINGIESKIPAQAASDNQLADKAFVNSSINAMAAFYITSNAAGDAFATKAALLAGGYYFQGALKTPTQNDYAIVLTDETKNNATTRYMYDGSQWDFQYIVNTAPLTQAQVDALNSNITAAKVTAYDGYANSKADKSTTLAGYGITDAYTKTETDTLLATKQDTNISGTASVPTTAWVADTTYADYGFRASVTIANVIATMQGQIAFDDTSLALGILSSNAKTYAGGVYIYASEVPSVAVGFDYTIFRG